MICLIWGSFHTVGAVFEKTSSSSTVLGDVKVPGAEQAFFCSWQPAGGDEKHFLFALIRYTASEWTVVIRALNSGNATVIHSRSANVEPTFCAIHERSKHSIYQGRISSFFFFFSWKEKKGFARNGCYYHTLYAWGKEICRGTSGRDFRAPGLL